ncbi:MAG: flagellin [Rhodocyclaceae bacterium]|nr:flagellin [Rhodocyclaceae bacterium]MBX3668626.1 flagellin [Rhodocyclaceae bacterium]
MASMINTNISSMTAQRNLNMSQASLTTALQRLSSGLRINSAKDDAAGSAIAERMTSQVRGLNQAVRNANDGISLAQTAEGAITNIADALQRMRELAVQASNASNSSTDRASLQKEVTQLVQQINSVASQTNFNGVNLLDGTFANAAFQVGANANQTITINSIGNMQANALGVGSTSSYAATITGATIGDQTNSSSGFSGVGGLYAGALTLNGIAVGATSSDGVSTVFSDGSAIAKAAAINAVSGQTGVTATVGSTTVQGAAVGTAGGAFAFALNGVTISGITGTTDANANASAVAAAINAKSVQTGVTANYDTTSNALTLTASDGRNIQILDDPNGTGGSTMGDTGLTGNSIYFGKLSLSSTSATGIQVGGAAVMDQASVTSTVTGVGGGYDFSINNVRFTGTTGTNVTKNGEDLVKAINAQSQQTGVVASFDAASATLVLNAGGQSIVIDDDPGGTGAPTSGDSALAAATTTVDAGTANTVLGFIEQDQAATVSAGAGVATLDLTTVSGAQTAIQTLDSALQTINNARADLGALQNRFTSSISNLQTTSDNLSSARSRIQDADFAAETANLSRAQILQQAGTAMLAQANSAPQTVLKLLG